MKLYHGTNSEFKTFDLSMSGVSHGAFLGRGIYLTSSRTDAQSYGTIIYEVDVDISNLLDLRNLQNQQVAATLPDLRMKDGNSWKAAFDRKKDIKNKIQKVNCRDSGGWCDLQWKFEGEWHHVPRQSTMFTKGHEKEIATVKTMRKLGYDDPDNIGHLGRYFGSEFAKAVVTAGFDGVIHHGTNIGDRGDEYVIMNPRVIKNMIKEARLRRYIRKLLLESPELQNELDEFIFNREDNPNRGFGDTDSTAHRDYAASQTGDASGRYKKYVGLRREVKAFWNEHADHDFWNTKIAALHDLGYYEAGISNTFYEDAELKAESDLPFASFVKKYPPAKRQKDEMSAYGCYDDPQEIAIKMSDDDLVLCVKLKGVVTYASATDSFTESRSEATAADLERHKSSGMPKRPAVSQAFQSGLVLFDEEDLKKRKGNIGELVIDNWTWDTVYVSTVNFPQWWNRKLEKFCKENEINLVQI